MKWSKSSVGYGWKIVNSALEGARVGEGAFLKGEPLVPYLSASARRALPPAFVGACLGAAGGYIGNRKGTRTRVLACGLLGGILGFVTGLIWDSRDFTASMASGAWTSISRTRDEHWFEKNPIDYA